jgi:uncharacterized protein YndB with AHSA1/START domain
MSITSVVTDPENFTMTVTAEYDVNAERAWQLWGDPRQLERWWGPPTYPATVVDHDLRPGGSVTYFMTGPSGDKPHGFWDVLECEAPRHLLVSDGFADDSGTPIDTLPRTRMRLAITDRAPDGVTVTIESRYASLAAMEQLLAMGMEEGLRAAMGQIDAVLAGSGTP